MLKNFFVLLILHDPLINKLLLEFRDHIIEDLELEKLNGVLDKEQFESQCYIENFEKDLINQLRKFREVVLTMGNAKNSQGGCKQALKQRWVEWYRHLYHMDFFQLHTEGRTELRLQQLVCEEMEGVSDDSDEDRDTKFNIFDQTDMIEEEDGEYDEEIAGEGECEGGGNG